MAAPESEFKDLIMKKLHVQNGLALLAALTFLVVVSSATTLAVAENYASVEIASAATTN